MVVSFDQIPFGTTMNIKTIPVIVSNFKEKRRGAAGLAHDEIRPPSQLARYDSWLSGGFRRPGDLEDRDPLALRPRLAAGVP
jgi:hypothetical protein